MWLSESGERLLWGMIILSAVVATVAAGRALIRRRRAGRSLG